MLRAGAALRSDADPVLATARAAEAALGASGAARADAALLFTTLPADLARCCAAAREALGGTGALCAVAGHAIAVPDIEAEGPGSVAVVALAGVSAQSFTLAATGGLEDTIGPEIESLLGRSPSQSDLIVVFADPLSVDPGRLVESLDDLAPACVVGAGSALARPGAPVLVAGERGTPGGVCGIVVSLTTQPRVAVSQGCRRVGGPHTVTRVDGHWVLEIDGKPALDVYVEAAGEPLAEDLRRAVERILVALPRRSRSRREANDAWVARRVSGFAPERRALALPEPMRAGDPFWFALRDADLARDDLREALERVTPTRAALYFGASDRGRTLFRHEGVESAVVAQALAPAPFAGLFGSFEIAPLGDRLAHLAHAGVIVALE